MNHKVAVAYGKDGGVTEMALHKPKVCTILTNGAGIRNFLCPPFYQSFINNHEPVAGVEPAFPDYETGVLPLTLYWR